jgi:hypothetical protein
MTALSADLPVKGLKSSEKIMTGNDEFALRLRGRLPFN